MCEKILVNRLGSLSLPRKSVVRLTDCPHITLEVSCGCKTTTQQQITSTKEGNNLEILKKGLKTHSNHSVTPLWDIKLNCGNKTLPYSFNYKTVFPLSKQTQKSRSIIQDGSRFLVLFWKRELHLIAENTQLIYRCRAILEWETPSHS